MKKHYFTLILALLATTTINAQDCNCMIALDSTFHLVPMVGATDPEYRNDDFSSDIIPLPFTFNLYGIPYTQCYINNNGNVSFGGSYYEFTASGFPVANFPMVASFWGDVDTRNFSSGLVYFKVTDHALIVRYDHVGYFANMADKVNDFQLIISDGQSDLVPDGHNIAFCYGDMQWTTGSASGGVDGFGGSPANVGANAGDGVNAMQIGLFNQVGNYYDGPFAAPDGIDYLDYSHIFFSTNAATSNQAPIDVTNLCDTIIGSAGDSIAFFWYDDPTQNIDYGINDSTGVLSIDTIPGLAVFNGEILRLQNLGERDVNTHNFILRVSEWAQPGIYPFSITATDNGAPALSVTSHYVLKIQGDIPTGVSTLSNQTEVLGYIANGQMQFKGINPNDVQQLVIYNGSGQRMLQSNKLLPGISTDSWPSGVYIYQIKTPRRTYTGKVIR